MRGAFLRGATLLRAGAGPGLALRRGRAAWTVPAALTFAGLAAALIELVAGRVATFALLVVLSAAIGLLALRADLDRWSFDGAQAVRRTFELRRFGFREVRVPASDIRRVGYLEAGSRSRAWLETRAGEEHALVEGDLAAVKRIAEAWASAARLAARDAAFGELARDEAVAGLVQRGGEAPSGLLH
jgi:hypothetical protein